MANNLISESEALRLLNISDRHREWLQKTLPHSPTQAGRFYDRALVEALHQKLRCLTGDPAPAAKAPPINRTSSPVDSGVPVKNRSMKTFFVPVQLETR